MIIVTMLANVLALDNSAMVRRNDSAREVLEREVGSAIAAVPGLRVKLVNEPEQTVANAKTSGCHTRFRAGGATYDFDWSTPTGAPVRSQSTSFSGFVNGKLAAIMIPAASGNSDRQRLDALFQAVHAYWEHCNPGAAGEDDW